MVLKKNNFKLMVNFLKKLSKVLEDFIKKSNSVISSLFLKIKKNIDFKSIGKVLEDFIKKLNNIISSLFWKIKKNMLIKSIGKIEVFNIFREFSSDISKLILKSLSKIKVINYFVFILIITVALYGLKKYSEHIEIERAIFYKELNAHNEYSKIKSFLSKKINSPYINIKHKLKKGETITSILKYYEIDKKHINLISQEIKNLKITKRLTENLIIELVIEKNNSKENLVYKVDIPISKTSMVKIKRTEKNKFMSEKIITKLFKKIVFVENEIKNNLYNSAVKVGVEPNIVVEFARIFGFEIDFQRDIREGDNFQILYEKFFDENGEFVKNGNILFTQMTTYNNDLALYRFGDDKKYGYFDVSGKSIQRALMKTPINGARLSSSFGMRKHPISGFTKMHQGTDFAAPLGTPIMASGTGTVILAKWCGGGGNCIKIKHNSTYTTIYAHLSKFARGIKAGAKVKQGRIIGYVGSTGISTGPHLHYEVVVNGKKVNSQTLKLPSGKILKNEEREAFEIQRIRTDVLIAETINSKG